MGRAVMSALESRCHPVCRQLATSPLPAPPPLLFPSTTVTQLKLPFVPETRKAPVVCVIRFIYSGSLPVGVRVIIIIIIIIKIRDAPIQYFISASLIKIKKEVLT